MVTKLGTGSQRSSPCSVLAKILMVTKQCDMDIMIPMGSVLAKILMVTKLDSVVDMYLHCSVLAKILMVTKLQAGRIAKI